MQIPLCGSAEDGIQIKRDLEAHFVQRMKKENNKLMKLQEDALVKRQKLIQTKMKVRMVRDVVLVLVMVGTSSFFNGKDQNAVLWVFSPL